MGDVLLSFCAAGQHRGCLSFSVLCLNDDSFGLNII